MPRLMRSISHRVYDESVVEEEDLCAHFMLRTSAQGCSRIWTTDIYFSRAIWIAVVVLGVIGTCGLIGWRVRVYFNFGTHFMYDRSFGSVGFPAVTLCNANAMSKSKLASNTTTLRKLRCATWMKPLVETFERALVSNEEKKKIKKLAKLAEQTTEAPSASWKLSDFFKLVASKAPPPQSTPQLPAKSWCQDELSNSDPNATTLTDLNDNPGTLIDSFGWRLTDKTLLDCNFRRRKCSIDNFIQTVTALGNCYTFAPPAIAEEEFFQDLAGNGNGLQFIINIELEDTFTLLSTNALNLSEFGLRLAIHSPFEPALVDSRGISIGPGLHSYIAIDKTTTVEMEPPYGNCTSAYPKEIRGYPAHQYSRAGCIHQCMMAHVETACNCLPYFGNETNDARPVNMSSTRKSLDSCSILTLRRCVIPSLADFEAHFAEICHFCLVGCTEVYFNTYVTSAPISTLGDVLTSSPLTGKSQAKTLVVADVFFPDMSEVVITRVADQTIDGLIADIGGNLGILMGLSLISFIELLEFCIYCLVRLWFRLKHSLLSGNHAATPTALKSVVVFELGNDGGPTHHRQSRQLSYRNPSMQRHHSARPPPR